MIEQVALMAVNAKGAIIGAVTGATHESYIVIRKKSRPATLANYFLAIFLSSFVGWISHGMLSESNVSGWTLTFITVLISGNSFIMIQVLTNPQFFLEILGVMFPNRLSDKKIESLRRILKMKK